MRRATTTSAALLAALFAAAPAAAELPVRVAPGVYALIGRGEAVAPENLGRVANVAFVVGPRGVVVVDSGVSARQGRAIIATIRQITRRPIRLVVLTHPSQEVIFGAAAFQAQHIPVLMHRDGAALMSARCAACLENLRKTLGAAEMAGSRVVRPDRLVDASRRLDVIGRPLLLIASTASSAPGALSILDETTGTLIAGSVVSIDSVPDMRDGEPNAWMGALATLKATHCAHLIPAYGGIGTCADIGALEGYFDALDSRVRALLRARVGLAELRERAELPNFARWQRYTDHHFANAQRTYLRLERLGFE